MPTPIDTSLLVLITLLLFSCSNHAPAPVVDISKMQRGLVLSKQPLQSYGVGDVYQVKPGDTLFSIAWHYSLDYKRLAKANQLKAYRIYPGQKLKLILDPDDPINANETIFSPQSLRTAINQEIVHKKSNHRKKGNGSTANNHGQKNQNRKQALASHQGYQSKKQDKPLRKASKLSANVRKKHHNSQRVAHQAPSSAIKRWIWPVNGKVINYFSSKNNQNKGVDIAAKLGTPVRATAKGRVVYSGKGLRGYGQLVIIKHNDNYLSAYAHNNKIHVSQNEMVKAGQRIADLGRSDADREKLHFEIRYKGKPVDPLNYLPESGHL